MRRPPRGDSRRPPRPITALWVGIVAAGTLAFTAMLAVRPRAEELQRGIVEWINDAPQPFAALLACTNPLLRPVPLAEDNVHDQLAAQQIFFPPASALQPNENNPCLKTYAEQQLVTGKQAQCYADHYIAVHLSEVNDGKTYSQTSNELRALPDQTSEEAQALSAKTQTLFQGETLRGLLLTSYGFSIFGDRAQTVAYICYGVAAILLLASVAGFFHARSRTAEQEILPRVHNEADDRS